MNRRRNGRRRRSPEKSRLTVGQILEWVDEHRRQTGRWPGVRSAPVGLPRGWKWLSIDGKLRTGQCGLPPGWSFAKLLAHYRGVRNSRDLPPLTVELILEWADAYFARFHDWPRHDSGLIEEATIPDETWHCVEGCLRESGRGMPGGSSLMQFLTEHRGVRNRSRLPQLTTEQILGWAQSHFEATGDWPRRKSGVIDASPTPGDTWERIDQNLRVGDRGLPGGSSLDQLLAAHRSVRRRSTARPLTEEQILAWADAYRAWHGKWPIVKSGTDSLPHGERWNLLEGYLQRGIRGLPGGSSLAKLLATHRGARNRMALPQLTEEQVLQWADVHHQRTGKWPLRKSGPIGVASHPGDAWRDVDNALRKGYRGLIGESSLSQLLEKHRGVPRYQGRPRRAISGVDGASCA